MDPPKKSISMGQIQASNSRSKSGLTVKSTDEVDGVKGSSIGSPRKKEYKSEYKNKFRPFSQYEYVGEGKFFNTTNSPPTEVDGPSSLVSSEKMEGMESGPWYKEVQELRKVANDYKCRGWGTDLVPPHISQIYNHHEQAANRESLSALALAISAPRSLNKVEKNKENQRKVSPAPLRLSRPKTATSKTKKIAKRPESAPIPKENESERANLIATKPQHQKNKKGEDLTIKLTSTATENQKLSKETQNKAKRAQEILVDTKSAPREKSPTKPLRPEVATAAKTR